MKRNDGLGLLRAVNLTFLGATRWRRRGLLSLLHHLSVNESADLFPSGPILAFDSSTSSITMALLEGERVLGERFLMTERNHSVQLMPEIDKLLQGSGLRARDLHAIVVGAGPGSYTGTRIAVTVAKTFAWSLDVPLYAVSTLEAMALGGFRDAMKHADFRMKSSIWIVPVLDGRRGQAYTALFAIDLQGDLNRMGSDRIVPFQEQLREWWSQDMNRPEGIIFVGEVDGQLRGVIDSFVVQSKPRVKCSNATMAGRDVGAVARRHRSAAFVTDVHTLVPNYSQLAEAEVKLQAATAMQERGIGR